MGQSIKLEQIALPMGSKLAICISLGVILTTGITTNTLILHVLRRRNVLKRNTTLIWKHLLTSNLIGCLLEIPAIITLIIAPFIKVTEIIYQSIVFVTLLSSCGSFLLIFIDRIDCVTRPFEKRLNSTRIRIGLGVIWSAGLLGITLLSVKWIKDIQKKHVGVLTVLCSVAHNSLLALIILTFIVGLQSYYRIFSFIRGHNKNAENHGVSTIHRLRRRETGISKSICAQIALFAFFYIPYILDEIIKITWKSNFMPLIMYLILRVFFSFRYTCSTVVYCGMSQGVSRAVRETLNMKLYSKNFTYRSYCSTFCLDRELKRVRIPTPLPARSRLRIDTSSRIFANAQTNFCKKNINMNVSSKLKSKSNSTCDAFLLYSENQTRPITFKHKNSVDRGQSQESKSLLDGVSTVSKYKQLGLQNGAISNLKTRFHENNQELSEDKLSNFFHTSEFWKETTV